MKNDGKNFIEQLADSPPQGDGGSYLKVDNIKSARIEVISTADDEVNISEPSSPHHPQYPYNKVEQTLSGHVFEKDDTPNAERIMEMHRSGTFYEIHPDGTRVLRVYGDNFEIALRDNNLVVGGNLNITVQGDANILTKGNVKQKIGGDYNLTVHGNMTTRVRGNRLDYTKGNQTNQTNGNHEVRTQGTKLEYTQGNLTVQTDANYDSRVTGTRIEYTKDTVDIQTEGTMGIKSKERCTIQSEDDVVGILAQDNIYLETDGAILGRASGFTLGTGGSFNFKSSGDIHMSTSGTLWLDGSAVRINEPGPSVADPSIDLDGLDDKDPTNKDPKDKDPTGGLTIEDSVLYPSSDIIKVSKTQNNQLNTIIDSNTKYPKDRTKID